MAKGDDSEDALGALGSSGAGLGACPTWDPEAIDVFLSRDEADDALADCLRDEPYWRGFLWIEEIELAGTPPSPN